MRNDKKSALIAILAASLLGCGVARAQEQGEQAVDASDAELRARFASLDVNQDGRLSPQEYLGPRWRAWGRHAKGESISLAECALAEAEDRQFNGDAYSGSGAQSPQALCSIIDRSKDGSMSWGEFGSPAWEMFKSLDANGDGFLTYAEYSSHGYAPHRAASAPPEPSAAVKAMIQRDLARSNAPGRMVAGSSEQAAAPSYAAPGVSASAGKPAENTDEASRLQGIANSIKNWMQ